MEKLEDKREQKRSACLEKQKRFKRTEGLEKAQEKRERRRNGGLVKSEEMMKMRRRYEWMKICRNQERRGTKGGMRVLINRGAERKKIGGIEGLEKAGRKNNTY